MHLHSSTVALSVECGGWLCPRHHDQGHYSNKSWKRAGKQRIARHASFAAFVSGALYQTGPTVPNPCEPETSLYFCLISSVILGHVNPKLPSIASCPHSYHLLCNISCFQMTHAPSGQHLFCLKPSLYISIDLELSVSKITRSQAVAVTLTKNNNINMLWVLSLPIHLM